MKRHIERVYELTADEVRTALFDYLRARDVPTPSDYSVARLEVTDEGARIEWSDDIEQE